MPNSIDAFLQGKLLERVENANLRQLYVPNDLIDFCSNDYLGLSTHPEYKIENNNYGATGSRLISGNSTEAEETELLIAAYHHTEAALIFNTGYMANLGLCSAIADKSTVFFCDEFIHASTIDGVRMSRAGKVRFAHNDVNDLEKKLSSSLSLKKIVLVESIYSMNGDLAPLEEIVKIAEAYGAQVIVDEAHATGIIAENGAGLVQSLNLEKRVWCRIHTYSKAMGLHGAAVVGSQLLIDYLINFARPFIYATALPVSTYQQISAGYQLFAKKINRTLLLENITIFRQIFNKAHWTTITSTPIQIVSIKGNKKALACSEFLKSNGIYTKAILSPTVPVGAECLRICLHSFNTRAEIELLFQSLQIFLK